MSTKTRSGRWRPAAALASAQHGVISRRQLAELGFSGAAVSRAVGEGQLHRVFRGVYAVGHRAIGERGRMLAATLVCGDGAVVSHLSAAALHGLVERVPAVVDVTTGGSAGRSIDGIRPHHVPAPDEDERLVVDSIPCTTTSRTIVDLAAILGSSSLRRVLERAAVARALDVSAIEMALAHRRRGASALRELLADWRQTNPESTGAPRFRSVLEARLLTALTARGVAVPLCNRVVEVAGKRYEVDLLWLREKLVVELDGRRFHADGAAFERDRRRDRRLALAGFRVLRVTWRQMKVEEGAVIDDIRRLLETPPEGTDALR